MLSGAYGLDHRIKSNRGTPYVRVTSAIPTQGNPSPQTAPIISPMEEKNARRLVQGLMAYSGTTPSSSRNTTFIRCEVARTPRVLRSRTNVYASSNGTEPKATAITIQYSNGGGHAGPNENPGSSPQNPMEPHTTDTNTVFTKIRVLNPSNARRPLRGNPTRPNFRGIRNELMPDI